MVIQICVGSSCCLKGSYELADQFRKAVSEKNLDGEINLAGSFCKGKCNREGVTVSVNDDVYTGVTPEKFNEFWENTVMKKLKEERA